MGVAKLAQKQQDWRVRLWLRLGPGGQRASDLARELGYADASGPLRVAQRLEAAARHDAIARERTDVQCQRLTLVCWTRLLDPRLLVKADPRLLVNVKG